MYFFRECVFSLVQVQSTKVQKTDPLTQVPRECVFYRERISSSRDCVFSVGNGSKIILRYGLLDGFFNDSVMVLHQKFIVDVIRFVAFGFSIVSETYMISPKATFGGPRESLRHY